MDDSTGSLKMQISQSLLSGIPVNRKYASLKRTCSSHFIAQAYQEDLTIQDRQEKRQVTPSGNKLSTYKVFEMLEYQINSSL